MPASNLYNMHVSWKKNNIDYETPVLQEAWVFQGRLCEEWVGMLGGWVAVGINGA